MTDDPATSSKFKLSWDAWVAQLAHVGALATTQQERALVLRVKQVMEGSDLVAQLCHDAKDPLASMLMGVALLQKAHGREPAADAVASAARRIDRVITAAQDLALLRRGEYRVHLLSLPVGSLVTTLVEQCQATVPRSIRINLVIQPDLPNARGDANAFSRIVRELLDNAVAFSNDSGLVDVHVTANGEHAILVIADQGPGIDEAHLPHVFDEARNRTHRPRRGAGRGLPIAEALAILQDASLTLGRVQAGGGQDSMEGGCEATLRMRLA